MRPSSARFAALAIVLAAALVLSGCPQTQPPAPTAPKSVAEGPPAPSPPQKAPKEAGEEHVPAAYASLRNPLKMDAQTIAKGKALFAKRCAGCHGPQGKGDGPAAAKFTPPPANLADPAMQKEMTDAAYFWRISEGIKGTAMPSFKKKLTEDQRWCLVCCVRALGQATK